MLETRRNFFLKEHYIQVSKLSTIWIWIAYLLIPDRLWPGPDILCLNLTGLELTSLGLDLTSSFGLELAGLDLTSSGLASSHPKTFSLFFLVSQTRLSLILLISSHSPYYLLPLLLSSLSSLDLTSSGLASSHSQTFSLLLLVSQTRLLFLLLISSHSPYHLIPLLLSSLSPYHLLPLLLSSLSGLDLTSPLA